LDTKIISQSDKIRKRMERMEKHAIKSQKTL